MTERKKNPFDKSGSDLDTGIIKATGVGIREGEISALDNLGTELGAHLDAEPVARNTLMRIAIRRLLEGYLSGEITLDDLAGYFEMPEKPSPKLRF